MTQKGIDLKGGEVLKKISILTDRIIRLSEEEVNFRKARGVEISLMEENDTKAIYEPEREIIVFSPSLKDNFDEFCITLAHELLHVYGYGPEKHDLVEVISTRIASTTKFKFFAKEVYNRVFKGRDKNGKTN